MVLIFQPNRRVLRDRPQAAQHVLSPALRWQGSCLFASSSSSSRLMQLGTWWRDGSHDPRNPFSNKFSASSDSWLRLRKGNNIYSISCHPDLDLFDNAVSASLVDLILPQFLDLVPPSA
jgi:hypothetical protein